MKIKKITAVLLAGTILATSLTGCGIKKNAVAAKLDDQEISLGLVNFMCKYQQALTDDVYAAYSEYYGGDIWQMDMQGQGSTTWEQLVDGCVESAHELYTLKAHMSDYGVSLSDDDKKAITKAASDFMEANSKEAIKELGATQDIVEEMLTLYTIKSKMHELIIADADTEVSDEEANCKAYSYITISKSGHYENSELVEYTEEELAQLEVQAELISSSVTDGLSLEDAAEENSLEVSEGTYDADDTSIDADLKDALDKLKEGEVTPLVDTDSAYYVARLDSEVDKEATEKNRETIVSERQEAKYEEVLTGWQDDSKWKVYDKKIDQISIKNKFTKTAEESTEATTEASTTEASSESVDTTGTESVEAGTEAE